MLAAILLLLLMNACYARAIALTSPVTAGGMSLTEALLKRKSVRSFTNEPLNEAEISQLLWAAQGTTREQEGKRTAPSAGAKYPLEVYLVTESGSYHYVPEEHSLEVLGTSDKRRDLEDASLEQEAVGDAPAVFVVAAKCSRTEEKYGSRADRYCKIEAGHVCQNLLLQATALELGGVSIGAFDDDDVRRLLGLSWAEEVLYVIPVGRPESSIRRLGA